MDLNNRLLETAQEIFSTMVMIDISLREVDEAIENISLTNSMSGVVGFAGTHKGVLAIHLPEKAAIGITSSFLGMDVESLNEDVDDAIGELANMLGGNVKAILSEKGRDIDLSLPSTVKGKQYNFQPTKDVQRHIIPLTSAVGDFVIELQLEK